MCPPGRFGVQVSGKDKYTGQQQSGEGLSGGTVPGTKLWEEDAVSQRNELSTSPFKQVLLWAAAAPREINLPFPGGAREI